MSKYDKKFNQMVLNAYLSGEGGYASLAERFGVLEPTLICNWLKKWQMEGIEGLSRAKKYPLLSNKPKKKIIEKQLTKEQQLEKEVELLKVENAY